MPVNNLSERALLRVQRLLETEEQMKREDEAALVMTEVSLDNLSRRPEHMHAHSTSLSLSASPY